MTLQDLVDQSKDHEEFMCKSIRHNSTGEDDELTVDFYTAVFTPPKDMKLFKRVRFFEEYFIQHKNK